MSDVRKKRRYKHVEGKSWIEVRVKTPQQLFDVRDPAPFRERDLDDDFIEYVFSAAREFSFSAPLKIVIYVEEAEGSDLPGDSIREALHSYLAYRIDIQRSELRGYIKRAQLFFLIGLVVLASCISVAQGMTIPEPPGLLGVLREGIVIFGWVSMWKPLELVLFDWYPLFEKLRFYKKLLETPIDVRFSA